MEKLIRMKIFNKNLSPQDDNSTSDKINFRALTMTLMKKNCFLG